MKVSLVIPTFNRSEMLRELLVSVAAQSHRPVEVVIIDDASTDDTADVVREFFAQQSHDDSLSLSYERLEGQSGAPVARNRGVALARGDAAMFVDSDDILANDGIHDLARRLEAEPRLAYAYGKVAITGSRVDPAPNSWRGVVGEPFNMHPANVSGYHWHTMGALYRRECVERVGIWNVELTGSQDWEFQARVKMFGGEGAFVDTLVGYWRQHESGRVGATSFRPDYVESVMKACASILEQARVQGKCDTRLEQRLAKRLVVHALEWGGNGHRRERRRCLNQALHTAPNAPLISAAVRLLFLCPSAFDRGALRLVRRLQQRA
jgi:glycosyltransferase involved in cell wall biosynthesis